METPRTDARRRLMQLASTQSGYFSAADALAAGYSRRAQHDQAKRGNWQRIQQGIYQLADWPAGDHDDLVLWTLWSKGHAVVSHQTALAVYRLGDANPSATHLTVPTGFRKTADNVVLHRAMLSATDVEQFAGFRVTTPLRTIIDVADSTADFGVVESAISEALDQGRITVRQLVHESSLIGPHAQQRVQDALRNGGHG